MHGVSVVSVSVWDLCWVSSLAGCCC